MIDDKRGIDDPCKLVGYLNPGIEAPTFILPVFRNLENDQFVLQLVGETDQIQSFIDLKVRPIALKGYPNTVKRIGSDALYGIMLKEGEAFFGERLSFNSYLKAKLKEGLFETVPAFALTIAKFIGETDDVSRLKKLIFASTPVAFSKTRKHFLENDVVRDTLSSRFSEEYKPFIKGMRINIQGNKVSINLPDEAAESSKADLGKEITKIVKDFTLASSVELSFEVEEEENLDHIVREVNRMKSGVLRYEPDIFDSRHSARLVSHRDACVIIPEAADKYITTSLSRTDVFRSIIDKRSPISPISTTTARKIVELEPVSLVSAMLFRMWKFLDIQETKSSSLLELHICRFRVMENFHDTLLNRLKEYRSIPSTTGSIKFFSFPMSLLCFMHVKGVISENELFEFFVSSKYGVFRPYFFGWEFKKEWMVYCRTAFKELSLSERDHLFGKIGFA